MKISIDQQYLASIGLGDVSLEDQKKAYEIIMELLNYRVTMKLAERLGEEKLAQLDGMFGGDDEKVLEWLRQSVPDYEKIVEDELAGIRDELKEQAESLQR